MTNAKSLRIGMLCLVSICAVIASHIHGQQVDPAKAAGLRGGLVVQLGAGETHAADDDSAQAFNLDMSNQP